MCWSCRKCLCKHCEHVCIAVSCSVKLFPNLAAALKGVFNRVLKNLRKASARFHREVRLHTREESGVLEKIARHAGLLPDIRGSHKSISCSQLMSTQSQRRRQWRPQSHPPSRRQARTRDRAVTAGALSHSTTAAHGCRLTACARTSPPARSIWPRWRASVYSSAGGALRTRIAKQVRATLGVTHLWTDIVAHAFSRAFRKPVLCCRGPDTFAAWSSGEHKSWRRSLRQEALSQPTAAAGRCMMVSHASRLREALSSQTASPRVLPR